MASLDDVRRIGLSLPGAVESDGDFSIGVMVKGKLKGFVWFWRERVNPKKPKVPNPEVLVIPTPGLMAKEMLLTTNPDVYFTEPHYDGYAAILVRLPVISVEELEEVLVEGWKTKASREELARFASQFG